MPLPITLPYTFANATTAIPLSNLDADLTTLRDGINGIGNGTNALSNVSITGGTITNVTITSSTVSAQGISNGTSNVSIATANGSITASTAGNLALTIDTSQNASLTGTLAMGSSFLRNRIINGDMRIDQRNAGASVTPTANSYCVDRWQAIADVSSKYSVQQVTDAPTGFINSLKFTSLSAYTVGTDEVFGVWQPIEGFNTSDLGFGGASAKTITLSFWVKSSLTGTFGGALNNSAYNRNYPFTYTISAANTWEQKTVTIAGDTTGTWLTTNGCGINVSFGIGVGTNRSAAAGSWTSTLAFSATGATSVVGTNGATWFLTGVQLEVGTVATPFERRQYGQELALCQRYMVRYDAVSVGISQNAQNIFSSLFFPVEMRAAPTLTSATYTVGAGNVGTVSSQAITTKSLNLFNSANNWSTGVLVYLTGNVAAEL